MWKTRQRPQGHRAFLEASWFLFCLLFYIQPKQAWPFCFLLQRIFVFVDVTVKWVTKKPNNYETTVVTSYTEWELIYTVRVVEHVRTFAGNPLSQQKKTKGPSYPLRSIINLSTVVNNTIPTFMNWFVWIGKFLQPVEFCNKYLSLLWRSPPRNNVWAYSNLT